jgi:predicted TPR repeat methyltransferase
MSGTFEQARAFFLRGLDHYQAGEFDAAERQFSASLALVPGRVSTLTNLGATRLKLGQPASALELLDQAVAHEADNAEAWGHRATALAELGRLEQALPAVEKALELDPRVGQAWSLRGSLLRDLGRPGEAAPCFERAIEHGADPELNRYFLAGVAQGSAPAAPPRHYVQQLFDGYAGEFDRHLVDVLRYRAPQVLVQGLQARRFENALDLGCGTGLCGPLLRPLAQRLEGIDLSAKMVRQAQATGAYDQVSQADLVEHLAATPRRHDLLVAADVFIYVGALDAVFAGARRVLQPAGVFCFSLEAAGDDEGLVLRPSLRYAHSERYIRMLAEEHGFAAETWARHPVREDQGKPIAGLFAWLVKR